MKRSALRTRISRWLGIVIVPLAATIPLGCTIEGNIDDLAVTTNQNAAGAGTATGERRSNQPPTITDGTSNTVQIGETRGGNTGGVNPPLGDGSVRNVAPADPGTGDSATNTNGAATDNQSATTNTDDQAQASAQITAAFGDKQFEFGSSSFFSSGSITENDTLELCAFGRFGMRVTRITTSSFADFSNDFTSERSLVGTWRIAFNNGAPFLVLNVDDASDPADIGVRRVALGADAGGSLLLDGARTSISDATADCAAAGR